MKKFWSRPAQRKNGHRTFRHRFGKHLAALLLLLSSVLIGFFLAFPDRALQRLLEQELSQRLSAPVRTESVELGFPPQLQIKQLTIGASSILPLSVDSLRLIPLWSTLLAEQPGWRYRIRSDGGIITGRLDGKQRLSANAQAVPLSLPLPGMTSLQLSGTLTNGQFDGKPSLNPDEATMLKLGVANLRLSGLKRLTGKADELELGTLTVDVEATATTYRVEQLQLVGGHLEATGKLTVTPADPPGASRLTGSLTLHPTAGLDPDIAALLPLLGKKGRSGDYRLRLSGTLAAPRLR